MKIRKILPRIMTEKSPTGPSPDAQTRSSQTQQFQSIPGSAAAQNAHQQKGQNVLQNPETKQTHARALELVNKLLDASEMARAHLGSFRTKPASEVINAIAQSMGTLSQLVSQLPQNESLNKGMKALKEGVASLSNGNRKTAMMTFLDADGFLKEYREKLSKKV